jgi:LPXTG-site transpeptidase (sortase) family protein
MMKNSKRIIRTPGKAAAIIGFLLIAAGIVVLLNLAYTDIYTAFKQATLRNQWQAASNKTHRDALDSKTIESINGRKPVEQNTKVNTSKRSAGDSTQNTTPTAKPAQHTPVKLGSPFARIVIPRIELDEIVVEGVNEKQLALGPGHMEETAWPGEIGNMVISGHRVTHSRPFYNLDRLKIGDPVIIYTKSQKFTYNVVEKKVVLPTDLSVIKPTKNKILTLTTCNPRFSAKTRLIVHAKIYDN